MFRDVSRKVASSPNFSHNKKTVFNSLWRRKIVSDLIGHLSHRNFCHHLLKDSNLYAEEKRYDESSGVEN